MQSIAAISWFPTTALICGLIFGVLTLGSTCLLVLKEQRPSGISIALAALGTLLLVVSIWQSSGGNIREMQAKIAELEQQTTRLAKMLEATLGPQAHRATTLSDMSNTDTRLHTSLSSLQETANQQEKQIATLGETQTQLNTSLSAVKQDADQNADQVQTLSNHYEQASANVRDQLKGHQVKITEHVNLINDMMTQLGKLQTDFTMMVSDQSNQFENLEKERRVLATRVNVIESQHQVALSSLRKDIEAASSQGQVLNFVKVSTQRDLSNLRREVDQLQDKIQRLQGRRHAQ